MQQQTARWVRDRWSRFRLRHGPDPVARHGDLAAFVATAIGRLDIAPFEPLQYLEFGVGDGSSMVAAIRGFDEAGRPDASYIGFDSFAGLPPGSEVEGAASGTGAVGRELVEWHLARHRVLRRVRLVPGWFETTCVPEFAEELGPVHVVRLDATLPTSTLTALEFVAPILADPAVIVVADWFAAGPTGREESAVARAVHGFLRAHDAAKVERLRPVGAKGLGLLVSGVS